MTKPTAYSTDKNGITWLPVSAIRTDAGTQHRPALDEKAVEDYAQQMRAKEWNWRRSPIRITKEGDVYWMIGGFHRLAAAERADLKLIGCIVQPGTRREAILASFSENSHHGVRLDNVSKRNKVLKLLADEEWRAWSSHSIAKRCGVSHTFVEKLRVTVNADSDSTERTYVTKQGGVSKMETANIGKRSEKGADSAPADQPPTLADLDPTKWYPVSNLGKKVAFDPFDSYSTAALAEQYDITWRPMIADQLQRYPQQFGEYAVVPALPKPAPKPKVAATPPAAQPSPAPAPARTYPMGVHGNVQEDKYYPVMMPVNRVFDEPFGDRDSCLHSPKYPGNRPIYGQTLNHAFFYNKFSLAAPIIVSNDMAPAAPEGIAKSATPDAASPESRMIYETNDRFGDYVGSAQEQFLLDADYWGETARADELPTSTELTRYLLDPARFYAVDDEHKLIYHDPRLAAETIHVPYRAVSGSDLNHAPAFESYRLLDADLPAMTHPASAQAKPAKRVQDDKFYILDKQRMIIKSQPYDTPEAAGVMRTSPFYHVESGKNINTPAFDRWTVVAQPAPNGNGATKPGTPFMDKSNNGDGKDTPRSAWEARGVTIAQDAQKIMGLNVLDFRILVETNLVEVDEATLRRFAKPLKAHMIDCLHFLTGKIDSKAIGSSTGDLVTAMNEYLKASQPTTA